MVTTLSRISPLPDGVPYSEASLQDGGGRMSNQHAEMGLLLKSSLMQT